MKAPYSIVTTAGDRLVDELVFDEVAVNPSLSKSDFSREPPPAIESTHGGH